MLKNDVTEEDYYVTPKHEISVRCPVPNLSRISDIKERCKTVREWLDCRKRVRKEINQRNE